MVAAGVTVSVLLALALLLFDSFPLAAATSLAMVAFAALDIREVIQQFGASRSSVAALAVLVTVLHLAAAAAVCAVARSSRQGRDATRAV